MKNRLIATLLMAALLVAALMPVAATAEPAAVSLTLGVKETYQINTSAISGAEGKQLVFATSNKKVATVSAEGLITAKRRGTAKIAVGYDNTVLAVCELKVLSAPKSIKLSDQALILNAGDSKQLTATLLKNAASAVTYASDNEAVAKVDANGKVTAVAAGSAVVTAGTYNGRTAKCAVTVLAGAAPTTLTLNTDAVSIQVKESFKLAPSVESGAEAAYAYASSNKKIAIVSADGVITGRKKGVCKVAVKTHNGLQQIVTVIVKGKLTELYGCLTNDPKTFLKYAKKLKLTKDTITGDTSSVTYYNSQMGLIMTANSCQVSLHTVTSPKYCLQGIDVSMTVQQAANKLITNGWALADTQTSDGVETRAFTKGGDTSHYLAISTDDGSVIRGIDAVWTW